MTTEMKVSADVECFAKILADLAALLESRIAGADREGTEQEQPLNLECDGSMDGESGPLPGPIRLARAFGLSKFELDVLCLAAGVTVDERFRALAVDAGARSASITIGFAAGLLLPQLPWRVSLLRMLGNQGKLVRQRLVQPYRGPWSLDSELRPTARAIAGLLGERPFAELPRFARIVKRAEDDLASWSFSSEDASSALRGDDSSAVCVVFGTCGVGKSSWARHVACAIADQALELDLTLADTLLDRVGPTVCEMVEDAALLGMTVVLDNADDILGEGTACAAELLCCLEEITAKVVIVAESRAALARRLVGRSQLVVELVAPPVETRRQLWANQSTLDDETIRLLANIELTPRQISSAAKNCENSAIVPIVAAMDQLQASGPRDLLLPTQTDQTLDDLVLHEETRTEIVDFIDAIRSRATVEKEWDVLGRNARGRGLNALFEGDSGTGKTLASEIISRETGLPLKRVNVASVVDKYIGETEKNLTRVFSRARALGVLLLFDEADALFGQRVEVSKSQDRTANLETNLLLQLMEDHAGVVILTTNLKRGLDAAFMRRIAYKVRFEPPDAAQRACLWNLHLPAQHLAEDIETDRIANDFPLTGGGIRNAVLRACYRAVARKGKITMSDLVECSQLESHAMGKVTRSSLHGA